LKAKQEEEYNKKYGPKAEDTLEKSSISGTGKLDKMKVIGNTFKARCGFNIELS
jgi:hypothetical protein